VSFVSYEVENKLTYKKKKIHRLILLKFWIEVVCIYLCNNLHVCLFRLDICHTHEFLTSQYRGMNLDQFHIIWHNYSYMLFSSN